MYEKSYIGAQRHCIFLLSNTWSDEGWRDNLARHDLVRDVSLHLELLDLAWLVYRSTVPARTKMDLRC